MRSVKLDVDRISFVPFNVGLNLKIRRGMKLFKYPTKRHETAKSITVIFSTALLWTELELILHGVMLTNLYI